MPRLHLPSGKGRGRLRRDGHRWRGTRRPANTHAQAIRTMEESTGKLQMNWRTLTGRMPWRHSDTETWFVTKRNARIHAPQWEHHSRWGASAMFGYCVNDSWAHTQRQFMLLHWMLICDASAHYCELPRLWQQFDFVSLTKAICKWLIGLATAESVTQSHSESEWKQQTLVFPFSPLPSIVHIRWCEISSTNHLENKK